MRAKSLLWCVGLVSLAATPAAAQSRQDDPVETVRQQIQKLQDQLETLQRADQKRRRVAEIGGRPRTVEEAMVVRIYDLADLFVVAPPYEARRLSDLIPTAGLQFPEAAQRKRRTIGGGFGGFGGGGGGGGLFNIGDRSAANPASLGSRPTHLAQQGSDSGPLPVASPDVRLTMDSLIDAIERTIEPESWEPLGDGTIEDLGNSLVVSATPSVHHQVEELIAQIRERWGKPRTVSARAYWLWLNDAELDDLLATDNGDDAAGDDARPESGAVRPDAWQRLIEARGQDGADRPAGYRAAISCYDGQTVYTIAGGQSLAVTAVVPIVGQESVGYQPITSLIQEGAILQITPRVTRKGKHVVLDVHSRVNLRRAANESAPPQETADDSEGNPAQPSAAAVTAGLDRPLLMHHRLSTTLRVPIDQPALVGGMTFESSPAPGDADLYLFVKLSVQDLAEEPAEAADEGAEAEPADSEEG